MATEYFAAVCGSGLYSECGRRTTLPQQGRGNAAEEDDEGREEKPGGD